VTGHGVRAHASIRRCAACRARRDLQRGRSRRWTVLRFDTRTVLHDEGLPVAVVRAELTRRGAMIAS
jgi:hypothetical protein